MYEIVSNVPPRPPDEKNIVSKLSIIVNFCCNPNFLENIILYKQKFPPKRPSMCQFIKLTTCIKSHNLLNHLNKLQILNRSR